MGLQIVSGVVPSPAVGSDRALHMFTAVDHTGADLWWTDDGKADERGASVGVVGDFAFKYGARKTLAAPDLDVRDGWMFLLPRGQSQATPFVYWGYKGRSELTDRPLGDGPAEGASTVTTSTSALPPSQHIVFYLIVESLSEPDVHGATVDNVFVFCWGYL